MPCLPPREFAGAADCVHLRWRKKSEQRPCLVPLPAGRRDNRVAVDRMQPERLAVEQTGVQGLVVQRRSGPDR
jgi:hypothetical protein